MLYTLKPRLLSIFAFTMIITGGILSQPGYGQSVNPGDILRAGAADSNTLLEQYFRPFGVGFGEGLNAGWFTSPKPHQKYGFDLRIGATAAIVPDFDKLFNIDTLPLERLKLLEGPPLTPTFFGDEQQGTRIGETFINPETGVEEELYSFDMPSGIEFPYVITPMAQLTLGLLWDTDITLRIVPTISYDDDFDTGLFGIGIQHGISQWLDGVSDKLDVSVQIGYTRFRSNIRYRVDPEAGSDIEDTYPASTWDGQNMRFQSNAFTSTLILGKQWRFASLYTGVGFQNSMTTLNANGSYPIVVPQNPNQQVPGGPTRKIFRIDDPLSLEFENRTRLHYMVGARVRLAPIAISANYTFARYNNLNVGIGFSFR